MDLNKAYNDIESRKKFESRWESFYYSNDLNEQIFIRKSNKLIFKSQQLIPRIANKITLIFMFGNPVQESVINQAIFSTGNNLHRVWKLFFELFGINYNRNTDIKQKQDWLINSKSESPFELVYTNYYSFPTSSSGIWSGVTAIHKLFGLKKLRQIAEFEKSRIKAILDIKETGKIISFQKDGFSGLTDRLYSIDRAKIFDLNYPCNLHSEFSVIGSVPTRYLNGIDNRKKLISKIINS